MKKKKKMWTDLIVLADISVLEMHLESVPVSFEVMD
jgi:hypothetical protein